MLLGNEMLLAFHGQLREVAINLLFWRKTRNLSLKMFLFWVPLGSVVIAVNSMDRNNFMINPKMYFIAFLKLNGVVFVFILNIWRNKHNLISRISEIADKRISELYY